MSLLPTRIIDINSDNRTSGTNSNFTMQLPNLDQRGMHLKILKVFQLMEELIGKVYKIYGYKF